jgi:hypothetical protein
MTPVFAQTGPPSPGGGGDRPIIEFPTVDWPTLIPQLVNYFFDAIGRLLNDTLHSTFDGVWSSGANVVGQTDLGMTWGFGPVGEQVQAVQTAARVILIFAVIVMGLRGMLSSIIPRQPDLVAEFINGVLAAVIMVAAFPLLVPLLIDFTNQAANAVGRVDLSGYLSTGGVSNPVIHAVLFLILLLFALRLLIKAVWRIGFLAVLLPVGMLACALYALPQTRWLLAWWVRVWGGMLLAQVPSVFALSIGAQLFTHGGGLVAFVYSIAFLQLATDVYSLIPFGGAGSGGPPWGLSFPVQAVFGEPRLAASGLGGLAGGIVGTAGGVMAATVATRADGQTYGYQ